ncbi:MAG TPA: helix-turn-helix transcriptional regulator [Candidatus Pelethocola excrementipullorum]|nr:helix-turn-helix transcriptional regulator [Candidatus Pelethocola excrementipullorum]
MGKKQEKMEFRYYEMPENELVLALLGKDWIRAYGAGINSLHFHNYMEVGICHQGTGELILDEKHHAFKEHSIVVIPPSLPHITNSDTGTKSFWEWMYFDIETLLQDLYSEEILVQKKIKSKIFNRGFYFDEDSQPVVRDILIQIKREVTDKQHMYRESIKALLHMFVVELLRMGDGEDELDRKNQKNMIIAPALDYVEEHYQELVKVSSMADACNISESHFRRVFLESVNMRPLDYINLIRVQKACYLIQKTNYSMADIALQTGFENVSTFNRNFRKFLEMAPYQWKKSSENFEAKFTRYKISALKGW